MRVYNKPPITANNKVYRLLVVYLLTLPKCTSGASSKTGQVVEQHKLRIGRALEKIIVCPLLTEEKVL